MTRKFELRMAHLIQRFFESIWWSLLSALIVIGSVLVGNYASAVGHAIVYVVIRLLFAWLRKTQREFDERRAKMEAMLSRSPTDVQ